MGEKKDRWNDIPCSECKEPVRADAKRCPHCGHEFTEAEREERRNTIRGGLVGCGFLTLAAVFVIWFCSGEDTDPDAKGGSEEFVEPAAVFKDAPYRYCMNRDSGWLRSIMDRVEAARAELPAMTLSYERLSLNSGLNGSVIDDSKTGITFLFTAPHEGDLEANLWVWGNIDSETCAVPDMTGQFSPNRFDDGIEFMIE